MADEKPKMEPVKTKTRREGLHVHPKGTLAKQIKVSCASCISGHRSGECNHFDRILLQIRAAGRPSTTCHHSSSCGGACLKQKAFIIPGEEPKWCSDHRSCIENWEYSDHCPPYPVSAKRKAQSPSPQRESQTSSTASSNHKSTSDSTPTSRLTAVASCCSSESNAANGPPRSGPAAPPLRQPIMVTASNHLTPSTWSPKSESIQSPFSSTFNLPTNPLTQPLAPERLSIPHLQTSNTPFQQHSGLSYFDLFDHPYSQLPRGNTSTHPLYSRYIDDTAASYRDDLSVPHHHDDLSASFTLPATTIPATSSLYITAAAAFGATPTIEPQRQWKTHKSEEPQQCPGNGFQCPCDENCMCVDCYTHGRGFWTLPVAIADAQDALAGYHHEPPPPPAQISRSIPQDNPRRPDLRDDEEHLDDNHHGHGHGQFVDPQDLFNVDALPFDY